MLEHVPSVVGDALKGIRPGLGKTVAMQDFADVPETVAVDSAGFGHGAPLPRDVTEDGRKMSPPLAWRNLPAGTHSVALLVEDADSPTLAPLVHAIVLDLPGQDGGLTEGALHGPGSPGGAHRLGKNSYMKAEYLPPDPPSGHGPHRYVFQVFALDAALEAGEEPGRGEVVAAMRGHVLARGTLIGTYERP